jgi:hypothetical protein
MPLERWVGKYVDQIADHECRNSSSVILKSSLLANSTLPFNNPNGRFLTGWFFKDKTKFNVASTLSKGRVCISFNTVRSI